jgi:hypothetical protein
LHCENGVVVGALDTETSKKSAIMHHAILFSVIYESSAHSSTHGVPGKRTDTMDCRLDEPAVDMDTDEE